MHSTASDGTLSPGDLIRLAARSGLKTVALTDHDTVAGLAEARKASGDVGVELINGIEISCEFPRPGVMHLLGYGLRDDHQPLLDRLAQVVRARDHRNDIIISKLQAHGIAITDDMVDRAATGDVVGRPHIARVLVELGAATDIADAFKRFIGSDGIAYAPKETLTAKQAIDLIHDAGGVVSLAHPGQLRKRNEFELRGELRRLSRIGLDAIEVIHSEHKPAFVDLLTSLADRFRLLRTGGSDFHGSNKPHIRLNRNPRLAVPPQWADRLKSRIGTPALAAR
jgi:3',5'-nucleoside bisphosphate phosphatase